MERSGSFEDGVFPLDVWQRGIKHLQGELDPQIFSAYIEPLKPAAYDKDNCELTVAAPSKLVCNHVDQNFKDKIREIISDKLGMSDIHVRFSVDPSLSDSISEFEAGKPVVIKKTRSMSLAQGSPAVESGIRFGQPINPRYTFENFVVGSSNQFCHAAAMRVAENPGQSYNPLFIYSGVGLGKTHLLHAIGNAVLRNRPSARVVYMSSESFTNQLIQSLRHARMDEFKNRMRAIEVLLIDDIQFMCGKERTQEEFFHTFNALYNAKHQIVITSDKIPQDIPGIEERLKTRFSWGLTADLQAPDFETRVAILKRKAALEKIQLPADVAQYIAEKISSNVRELEGAFTRLHAISSLQGVPISLELAESALKPLVQPKQINVTVDDIKSAVAQHFGIKVSEMVSKRRTKNLSFPRHIAMYLCRKHTTCSYPEIGTHFGGRDHSSVIHAANVVKSKLENVDEVKEHIAKIEQMLFG
ncbi:MAG: chromosomal replication initiator protein DnaA [Candidatus Dadabacteria bacterium]|nr:MAG: chromosomal replication initiator protein DnaA [Candidatus Dadabacteria bacterium]